MPLVSLGRKKDKEKAKQKKEAKEAEEAAAAAAAAQQQLLQQQPQSPKQVPRDFFECPMSDLTTLVASMLQELVQLNDALPFDANQLTRFHSRSPPGISIYDYLVRMTKFCTLEKSILLTIIYYIDLLCTTYQTFNINSLTVHRFMITAAMVASKGLCDSFCTNSHYAKVGGLSRVELNLLEVEFLVRVDYKIVPEVHLLNQYYERMVSRMEGVYEFVPDVETEAESPIQSQQTRISSLPSELAAQEHRTNRSSTLKRPSITDVIPNTAVHHPDEPKSTPIIGSPNSPKRTKHV